MAGSVINAVIGKRGADKAADAQQEGATNAIQEQRRQFDIIQNNNDFTRATGQQAYAKLADMFGVQRPVDPTVGLNQNLTYTAGGQNYGQGYTQPQGGPTPLNQIVPIQQAQAGQTQAGQAPIGQAPTTQQAQSGPFSAQELFAAQNLGQDPSQLVDGVSGQVGAYVGSDRLKDIRTVGDFISRATPEVLGNMANDGGGLDLSRFSEDEKGSILDLFQKASSGALSGDDFYSGQFGGNQPANTNTVPGFAPTAAGAPQGQQMQGTPQQGKSISELALEAFQNDPGYAFQLQQGEKAIKRGMAQKGTLGSGDLYKELLNFNQGLTDSTFKDHRNFAYGAQQENINNLMRLAGAGGEATNVVNNAAFETGKGVSESLIGAGTARAQGKIGGAKAIQGGVTGAQAGIMSGGLSSFAGFGGGGGLPKPYSGPDLMSVIY